MRIGSFVGGEERMGSTWDPVVDPFTGERVAEVARGSAELLEEAMGIASEGFRRTRKAPAHERIAILEMAVQLLEERSEELAQWMVREGGKPITLARGEVRRARVTFSLGIDVARRESGGVIPMDTTAASEGRFGFYHRVPRGPVAAITPFNFPLNLVAHKWSPALAVGAPMILKPSEQCPVTGLVLIRWMLEAGIAPEWIAAMHMDASVAEAMVRDPRMRVLSFTGSGRVGWHLRSIAGEKQVCLELGGNAPLLIDEGANLDGIMDRIQVGAWAHGGQVCIKTQRILVHQSLYPEFLERFISDTQHIGVGDPRREDTLVGPLIDRKSRDRVLTWIDEAVGAGAQCVTGGKASGNVVSPTVLTQVEPSMRVVCDEVFGPVTTVESFSTFEEGIQRANNGPYGLQAGVITPQLSRAMQAFEELQFGGVIINDIPTFRVDQMPYGGSGSSGIGREGVQYAAEDFTEPRMVVIRRSM